MVDDLVAPRAKSFVILLSAGNSSAFPGGGGFAWWWAPFGPRLEIASRISPEVLPERAGVDRERAPARQGKRYGARRPLRSTCCLFGRRIPFVGVAGNKAVSAVDNTTPSRNSPPRQHGRSRTRLSPISIKSILCGGATIKRKCLGGMRECLLRS